MPQTGQLGEDEPRQPQRCVRSTPPARRSDMHAGSDHSRDGCGPSTMRTRQAREHESSTSRVRNHAPTNTAVFEEIGPWSTHGHRPSGSSPRRENGRGMLFARGPRPRLRERTMSLNMRSSGPSSAKPDRSESALYCPR